MLLDDRAELLSRHLPGGLDVKDELALLARQPAEKQRIVEERLRVIDHYLAGGEQSIADADAAASRIGVGRRQFYRLLAKLRELGPVRTLSPGFRNVSRSAPTKDGLAAPIEAAIRELLSAHPDAKMTEIEAFVRATCDTGVSIYPGNSAIRRRVHALRRSAMIPQPRGIFGERMVIDQVALSLEVRWGSGASLSVVTFIIDRETRLICGSGLTTRDGVGLGLETAISNFRQRVDGFKKQSFSVADHIHELTWVVPPALEYKAEALSSEALKEAERQPKIESIAVGPRRHGDAILRLLGDRLGPHPFRRLAQLGEDPPKSNGRGLNFDDASALVAYCVDHWNEGIMRSFSAADTNRAQSSRDRRLDRLVEDLACLFAPVLAGVAARQAEARRRELDLRGDWLG